MDTSNDEGNYNNAKKEAKDFYGQLGKIWCPSLEDFIFFDDVGFHHLIWKYRKHRTKIDQKRRFRLLPHVREILCGPVANILYQEREIMAMKNRYGKIESAVLNAAYWAFDKEYKGQKITVIVRKIGNGEKHFYSIFDKT